MVRAEARSDDYKATAKFEATLMSRRGFGRIDSPNRPPGVGR
jgi:hypothetical protein